MSDWFPPYDDDIGLLGWLVVVFFQMIALACIAVVFVAPIVVIALWLLNR